MLRGWSAGWTDLINVAGGDEIQSNVQCLLADVHVDGVQGSQDVHQHFLQIPNQVMAFIMHIRLGLSRYSAYSSYLQINLMTVTPTPVDVAPFCTIM